MLTELNDFMRNRCSPLHTIAKTLASPWMRTETPAIAAVRILHGQVLRIHPRFLTANLDSIEPEVMLWIRRCLRKNSTALDIGANVGLHTMYMAKLVGGAGAVFAFEPSPANVRSLRYHIKVNSLRQVQIIERVVADQNGGMLPFFLLNDGDHSSNSLTFGRKRVPNLDETLHRNARVIPVEAISLDKFCADTKIAPDLIKIDVEGAELQVLRGSAQSLSSTRPKIILAVHPWWLPPGQTTDDIVAFLKDKAYWVTDTLGKPVTRLDYREYLCEPLAMSSRSGPGPGVNCTE
jgi:FkbM family methyltransferase